MRTPSKTVELSTVYRLQWSTSLLNSTWSYNPSSLIFLLCTWALPGLTRGLFLLEVFLNQLFSSYAIIFKLLMIELLILCRVTVQFVQMQLQIPCFVSFQKRALCSQASHSLKSHVFKPCLYISKPRFYISEPCFYIFNPFFHVSKSCSCALKFHISEPCSQTFKLHAFELYAFKSLFRLHTFGAHLVGSLHFFNLVLTILDPCLQNTHLFPLMLMKRVSNQASWRT